MSKRATMDQTGHRSLAVARSYIRAGSVVQTDGVKDGDMGAIP